jgi:hypothetical protein
MFSLSDLVSALQNMVFKVNFWYCTILLTIVCFLYNCITDPDGAINTFFIWVLGYFLDYWPSTPSQYKFWSILNSFSEAYPQIGWGPIYEIFQGLMGMLAIYLSLKVIRFLPFFS